MRLQEPVALWLAVLFGTVSSYAPLGISRRAGFTHPALLNPLQHRTTVHPWKAGRFGTTARHASSPVEEEMETDVERTDAVSHVSIEYCTGCKWMLRAGWMAEEILTTFQDDLTSVTLIPSRPPAPGGIFNVRINGSNMLWNRTAEGRFPEGKELKQLIRNVVAPERDLGHIDGHKAVEEAEGVATEKQERSNSPLLSLEGVGPAPNVAIAYCTACHWLLRAAWMAKELLTTFHEDLNSVTLVPSRPPEPGGRFTFALNGEVLWDRKEEGRHPEAKEVKQRVRDAICPSRDLGHSDVKQADPTIWLAADPIL